MHALAYVQSDIDGALRGACRGLQLGRRLVPGSSYLVEASSVPAWCRPMPSCWPTCWLNCLPTTCRPECEQAMQPLRAEEQSLCRAMQGSTR